MLALVHRFLPARGKAARDSHACLSVLRRLRNNKETYIDGSADDTIEKIEHRIARYTFLPAANGEPLHIMQYLPGQEYGASHLHTDCCATPAPRASLIVPTSEATPFQSTVAAVAVDAAVCMGSPSAAH